ncbi:MAG: alkaline phosphatase D family protein [Bacteroidota bacterium]
MKKILLPLVGLLLLSGAIVAQPGPTDLNARTQMDLRFAPFFHGVASGDPLTDRVIIWTRVTTNQTGPIPVSWAVATDTGMTNIVQSGTYTTSDTLDYTVKVDVTGLQPGTWYYYRFARNGRFSVTGRTFTAPTGAGIDSLRFAVVSCSNYTSGFFNAYGGLARRNDLHAVFHLGDYIYEGGGGDDDREHEPPNEILVLEDYRMRHSQYKLDEDLRCVHQMYPFIAVWDDHESANDSWRDGAENHTEGAEGLWTDRKSYALRAYYEWMPIRLPDPSDDARIFRKISYGDLLDVFMLDTRLYDRDEQEVGAAVNDPNRTMLGPAQLAWLSDGLKNSTARWKVLGQQVMMAPLEAFGFPINTDQWDGYPAERQRLYDSILTYNIKNIVVLTGDIHSAWATDLPGANYDPGSGANSIGVEFVTTSVTSFNSVVNIGTQIIQFANPHLKYINLADHGYYILDLNPSRAQADYFMMDNIDVAADYRYAVEESWLTEDQDGFLQQAQDTAAASVQSQAIQPGKIPPNLAINVEDPASSAGTMTLFGAYPNPFESDLMVKYYLHQPGRVRLTLTDLRGKVLHQIDTGKRATGLHFADLRVPPLPSGFYLLNLTANGKTATRRVFHR